MNSFVKWKMEFLFIFFTFIQFSILITNLAKPQRRSYLWSSTTKIIDFRKLLWGNTITTLINFNSFDVVIFTKLFTIEASYFYGIYFCFFLGFTQTQNTIQQDSRLVLPGYSWGVNLFTCILNFHHLKYVCTCVVLFRLWYFQNLSCLHVDTVILLSLFAIFLETSIEHFFLIFYSPFWPED